MPSNIIILNGPSSSGKSTLAKTLQTSIKETYHEEYGIVSIDEFLEMTADNKIYEDDVFEVSLPLCERSLKLLQMKPGIIIDHVITSERIFKQLIKTLQGYSIILIQVTCPVQELKKREHRRGNRCIGSAESSLHYLYPNDGYALTVNTYELSAEECSEKIIELLYKNH